MLMSGPNDGFDPLDPGAPQAASQMEAQRSSPVDHFCGIPDVSREP